MSDLNDLDSYKYMKLLLILILVSCQGYKAETNKNPFAQYNVKSIAVENFYNFTNLNNLSSNFTKEMVFMLSSFSSVSVKNNFRNADAVLVGVLESQDSRRETRVRGNYIIADTIIKQRNIRNNRSEFYIPTQTTLNIKLKLMLIKNFSNKDVKALKTKGTLIDPRVVFTEELELSEIYTREVLDGASNNFMATRSAGAERNAIKNMAKNAANTFKEMILYAF